MGKTVMQRFNSRLEGASHVVQRAQSGLLKRVSSNEEGVVIACRDCAGKMQIQGREIDLRTREIKEIDLRAPQNRGAEGDAEVDPCVEICCCPCLTIARLVNNILGLICCVICCIICCPICLVVSPIIVVGACCAGGSVLVYKKMDD